MKNVIAIVCLLIVAISCRKEVSPVPNNPNENSLVDAASTTEQRLINQEKVKLLKSWSIYAWVYAGAYNKEKSFYAEVKNLGINKKVYVHHKMMDSSWQDLPLKFLKKGYDSTDIWGIELKYGGYGSVFYPGTNIDLSTNGFGDEYVLKYVANGQTYWDNNGGNNYKVPHPYGSDGMFLQNGLNISADTYRSNFYVRDSSNKELLIYADLRNLGFQKEVKLIYSTNNWKTVKTAPLNFVQYYSVGNGTILTNPNVFGIEKWSVIVKLGSTATKVSYALSYKVNGVEYWDNNFGKNYTMYNK